MVAARIETPAHQPTDRFSIMPILNRKKKMCPELKVILLGNAGVGKTSLLLAMTYTALKPSTGVDFRVKMATLHDRIVKIQLWDTADQEKFGARMLPKSYFRHARGVLLVYDPANRQSFHDVVRWAAELQSLHQHGEPLGVVVVAATSTSKVRSVAPEVSTVEGHTLASLLNANLVEWSTCEDADSCFEGLVDALAGEKPWTVDLSDVEWRLQTLEATIKIDEPADEDSATDSESTFEADSEFETDAETDQDEPTTTATRQQQAVATSVPSPQLHVASSAAPPLPRRSRRDSAFFAALELGLFPSTSMSILPKSRQCTRVILFAMGGLMCISPILLLALLPTEIKPSILSSVPCLLGRAVRTLWTAQ